MFNKLQHQIICCNHLNIQPVGYKEENINIAGKVFVTASAYKTIKCCTVFSVARRGFEHGFVECEEMSPYQPVEFIWLADYQQTEYSNNISI